MGPNRLWKPSSDFSRCSAVTMLGADPGTGKSVFIYRVAEAAAYGRKFMGQLQCVEGNVLVVQKDESDSNMRQKRDLMGMKDPQRQDSVQHEVQRRSFQGPGAVDSGAQRQICGDGQLPAACLAAELTLKRHEAGLYLYKLNAIAAKAQRGDPVDAPPEESFPMSGDVRQNVNLS